MVFSLFNRRRDAKALALLNEAKAALQQQRHTFEEMGAAIANYHVSVFRSAITEKTGTKRNDIFQSLTALEEAATNDALSSRAIDQLTLNHCSAAGAALIAKSELKRDLPAALDSAAQSETPSSRNHETQVSKHLIWRIGRVSEAAGKAAQDFRSLDAQYCKAAGSN